MVTTHPSVAIIVLNWNNWRDTIECVTACQKLEWPNFRIIVVDNGSSDSSENILRGQFPDLEILQTGYNLGFAGGNNVGIHYSIEQKVDYVWLLNNDAITAPNALTALVTALQQEQNAACAGSKIYYFEEPQRLWCAGGIWEKGWLRLRQRGAGQIDRGQFDTQRHIASVSGCSMLIRAAAFQRVGMLNEDYFLYWEDTDWCAQAAKVGYSVLFVPTSKVWHKVSASVSHHSRLQYYYYTRNGLYFCSRNDLSALSLLIFYTSVDVFFSVMKGNTETFHGYYLAFLDFLRGRMGRREQL
jgi:GT2 family glycosyltransferase